MPFVYNANGLDPDTGGYTPAPEGTYNLIIRDVSEKNTKMKEDGSGGYPYIATKCEIDDQGEGFGKIVWHNVVFFPRDMKAAGMAVHFLKTIGEPYEGEFEVNEHNWIGKRFKAKVNIEKDPKGVDRNKIAYVIREEQIGAEDDTTPF